MRKGASSPAADAMSNPLSDPPAFLGVERSVTGRRWCERPGDGRMALALSQRLEVPEVVGRVLASRGVGPDEAGRFLNPTLRDMMPDPSRFKDMDVAAERLASAIMQGEQITVFGDYDVDGATSSALLKRFLDAVGARGRIYIPDRLSEGYGPNPEALLRLKEEGTSLVVTVDCGTTAYAALEAAAVAGLEVIVVDHHEAEPKLPRATAVVNPNRLDEDGGFRQLAAVGVTFLLVVAANRLLRSAGWYERWDEPDLMAWLDLVALGSVCDLVPLTGLNRAFVAQGLKVMARRGNPGLRALSDVAGIAEAPGTYHAGFVLGPRINAGGRIGASGLGARLLSTDDGGEAEVIARQLDALNRERREIEARVFEQALARVEEGPSVRLTFVAGEDWHPGVIGIVASRLVERFGRPACVVSVGGESAVGSGRSVAGIDLGAAVIAARQAGLVVKGGGHAMAAGFTSAPERVDEVGRFLSARVAERMAEAGPAPLHLDGGIGIGGASLDLVEVLKGIGPFGSGNPEPRFAISHARVAKADVVGDGHVRCFLTGEGGGRLAAIAFRSAETGLGRVLLGSDGVPLHIAGRLRENIWQGRSTVQMLIDDAASAWQGRSSGDGAS